MNQSKIETQKMEQQSNDAVKADGLPSAQVEQNPMLAAACQNIWYIPLPSGATQKKNCHKKAVKILNGVSMCERCFNKRSAKSSS